MDSDSNRKPPETGGMSIELYKLLKSESGDYFDKLQSIWLQKFVLVGSVIAFLATVQEKLPSYGNSIVAPAVAFAVPLLATLLDIKIVEFSLHARLISRYIGQRYASAQDVAMWESALWGKSDDEVSRALSRGRNLATVLTAAVPTIALILLSSLSLGAIFHSPSLFAWLGVAASLAYAAAAYALWNLVLKNE